MMVNLFVDDIATASSSKPLLEKLMAHLKRGCDLTVNRDVKRYIGYDISYTTDGDMLVSNNDYTQKLVQRYDTPENPLKMYNLPSSPDITFKMMQEAASKAPLPSKQELKNSRQIVGSLIYAHVRDAPEIGPSVSRLASTALRPSSLFYKEARRLRTHMLFAFV